MAENFQIISPLNGDMLHAEDGVMNNGCLLYQVRIAAPEQSCITVNGITATYADGVFMATISLMQYKNLIEVKDECSGSTRAVTVFRLTNFAGKYRLSIDDNIWFLQDIHHNEHRYTSIFDNPYLGFLKTLHDTYGTKVHFNLFYQTDGFNLSQLSDRYSTEWKAHAGWIRLSFHALQEKPDKPYQKAGYDVVKHDCKMVLKEIHRFAGEALTGPVTTLHWGEATVEGSRALRDAGYRGQLGYFNVDDDLPAVSYYLDVDKRRHLKKRFIWKDLEEDIVFIRSSIVLDKKELSAIVPFLNQYQTASHKPPYADLLIHEQYYYPFYEAYQPDYCDKIRTAVRWATDNGYIPAFLGDCIFE